MVAIPRTQTPDSGVISATPGPKTRWIALAPVLTVTFLGTVNNNIVNVPLNDIVKDFDVPLSQGALIVIAWGLSTAVLMPVMGWLGDRMGRRRLFLIAVATLSAAAIGAALSPTLPILVAFRVLQGAASAAVLPAVMGLVGHIVAPERRARGFAAWATANGLGQAVGPPLGGLLAEWLGWRSIFWPMGVLAIVAFVATLFLVPASPRRAVPLEWRGATTLTLGAALLLGAATAVPQTGIRSPVVWVTSAVGLLALAAFWLVSRRAATPFLPPRLLTEPVYLRSNLGVFTQMFCLGATLLAVPLYLTRTAGHSTASAGLFVFALPAAMAVLAPVAGSVTQRFNPLPIMRAGLLLVALAQAALGLTLVFDAGRGGDLVIVLLLTGVGVAFVQTPAATGATSTAGQVGAGLGLFNLVRFAGAMLGAAWVAVVLDAHGSYGLLFGVCAAAAILGLAGTFTGPSRSPGTPRTATASTH